MTNKNESLPSLRFNEAIARSGAKSPSTLNRASVTTSFLLFVDFVNNASRCLTSLCSYTVTFVPLSDAKRQPSTIDAWFRRSEKISQSALSASDGKTPRFAANPAGNNRHSSVFFNKARPFSNSRCATV